MERIDVVDQREIQRRGGKCARFPSSCVILDLLREAGLEAREINIFDSTYGEGRFWGAAPRPRLLVGADIRILDWVVEPDVFIKKPVWASWRVVARLGVNVDLYVVDPPFRMQERGKGIKKREHYHPRYALGSTELILREAVNAASRLQARYLLVKYFEPYQPGTGWRLAAQRFFRMLLGPATVKREFTSWYGLLERG